MNSKPQLDVCFENCQVIFENKHVGKNSPPAVSVTSEVSIASSDDSLCGDVQIKLSSQGLALSGHSTSDGKPVTRKRTISEVERPLQLLAQPCEDQLALHPLHAFIRQQIEVFTVEKADMDQPAPGRKNPIRLHQVGLRCIHCRHFPNKAKRAVCYPTSVGRVYHAVSDMKFDHFSRCTALPENVRTKLKLLRDDQKTQKERRKNKKKSSEKPSFTSTAQYYYDSAISMGMRDRDGAVYMRWHLSFPQQTQENNIAVTNNKQYCLDQDVPPVKRAKTTIVDPVSLRQLLVRSTSFMALNSKDSLTMHRPRMIQAVSTAIKSFASAEDEQGKILQAKPPFQSQNHASLLEIKHNHLTPRSRHLRADAILLSSPQDEQHLNEIHCFIRKQLEVFSATASDVNAPAPGRRQRIALGQVGIRCIHCAFLPARNRLKRAVCYPPSMKGIYHAVSNMKFDHFTLCQHLPVDVKDRFAQLYSSETRRSPRSRCSKGSRCSPMGHFYVESASKLGLVDTETEIRFQTKTTTHPTKLNDMTGMSALMIAATDPNIREAYFQKRQKTSKDHKHTF